MPCRPPSLPLCRGRHNSATIPTGTTRHA
jgi:hypothetical protein